MFGFIFLVGLIHAGMPDAVERRGKNAITSVADQHSCRADWAFAAVGAIESLQFIRTGELTALSVQQLIDCSHAQGNNGCNGGLPAQAFDYVMRNCGLSSAASYGCSWPEGACKAYTFNISSIAGYNKLHRLGGLS